MNLFQLSTSWGINPALVTAHHTLGLKFENGKVYVCLGSEWKSFRLEGGIYGTETNPGYSCKDILNKAGKQLSNGVFWIHLKGSHDAFPVFCDMVAGGWTLVFKVVSGVDKKVWDVYNSAQASAEFVTAALDITNQHHDHYKNRVVMNWDNFNPSQAKVILYEGAVAKKSLVFDASGTDKLNWYSEAKLSTSSCLISRQKQKNLFSIRADVAEPTAEVFSLTGTTVAVGLMPVGGNCCCMVLVGKQPSRRNKVLYSKLSTYTNWNTNANVGVADVLAVFVM
ncbi:hypothetical protein OS493_034837 [Desmophyllum pertusum]|uniref:Uncharacterized protein n=1 Tax=Desmophyllum pertusum TaxID=174260 RepID=A0A9W9YB38_9CNID|nr:hypothetical protein OS493_034837 [Desmophyllum pertusum]